MAATPAWTRGGWNPRMSMSLSSTKGLLNAPGDNNCFLNSAVQVLWHLDVFRRSFRLLSGHACMENSCIFCALKIIFTQFQFSDREALPPDALRNALAKTFADQQRFQLGFMDDAAECFENILLRIHHHLAHDQSEDQCKAPHCIPHQKFGMTLVEQMVCECGASSEPLAFSQMVHYASTSALATQKRRSQQTGTSHKLPSFGHMLRLAMSDGGEVRNCPGSCGRRLVQVRRTLTNTPEVVSVGLIWDSDCPSVHHISEVLSTIGTTLNPSEFFHSVVDTKWAATSVLHLVGVVCYYAKHYSTFLFHSKKKIWVLFDDAHVIELDPYWRTVVNKCSRGHFQPLLLLFADPNSTSVITDTAPEKTYVLPNTIPCSNHTRQRSFDRLSDGSGTIGGRSESTMDIDLMSSQQQRSVTPNPVKPHQDVTAVSRSKTPGPEWGKYHSDDEELETERRKSDVGHLRQSSYLDALGGDLSAATQSRGQHRGHSNNVCHSGSEEFCARNEGVMPLNQEAVAIDLLGPIPQTSMVNRGMYDNRIDQNVTVRPGQQQIHPSQNSTGYSIYNGLQASNAPTQYNTSSGTFSLAPSSDSVRYSQSGVAPVSSAYSHPTSHSHQVADLYTSSGCQGDRYHGNSSIETPSGGVNRGRSLAYDCRASQPSKGPHSSCSKPNPPPAPSNHSSDANQMDYSTMTQDQYGTYISRKTVQNILSHQGVKNTNPKPPNFPGHLQQDKTLRLDIPDSSSLNSNHDSGYRSGGSDRCSGSSLTSSVCMDSPGLDTQSSQYQQRSVEQGKTAAMTAQTQHAGPVNSPKLDQIPEHRAALYRNGSSAGAVQKPSVPAKPPVKPAPYPRTSSLCPDKEAELLLMEAESLMELSNEKQERNDIPLALLHCDKAIGVLQQALSLSGVDQDGLVRVRMKHNSYVLRSRSLHKQLYLQRQTSNQSNTTASSDQGVDVDHASISSASTDNDPLPRDSQHYRETNNKVTYAKQDSGYHGSSSNKQPLMNMQQLDGQGSKSREEYFASAPLGSLLPRSATHSGLVSSNLSLPHETVSHCSLSEDRSREVDIFATLPRRPKPKKPSEGKTRDPTENQDKMDSDALPVSGQVGALSKHSRQWSKEDIRSILVQDYYDRKGKNSSSRDSSYERNLDQAGKSSRDSSFERNLDMKHSNDLQPGESSVDCRTSGKMESSNAGSWGTRGSVEGSQQNVNCRVTSGKLTCSQSVAPPISWAPPVVSRSNSNPGGRRSLPTGGSLNPASYEDLINKQLRQMALKEKSRTRCNSSHADAELAEYCIPEKSHYAYRHQINLPPRSSSSGATAVSCGGPVYSSAGHIPRTEATPTYTGQAPFASSQANSTQNSGSITYVKPQTQLSCGPQPPPKPAAGMTLNASPRDADYFVGVSNRSPIRKAASHGQLAAHSEALSLGVEWRLDRTDSPAGPSSPPLPGPLPSAPNTGSATPRNSLTNEMPPEAESKEEEEWPAPPPSIVEHPPSPSPCIINSNLICGPSVDGSTGFDKKDLLDGCNNSIAVSHLERSECVSGTIQEPVISRPVVAPVAQVVEVENIVVKPAWSVQAACTCHCHKASPVRSRLNPCDMCKQTHKIVAKVERSLSNSSSNSKVPKLVTFQQLDACQAKDDTAVGESVTSNSPSRKTDPKQKKTRRSHSADRLSKRSSSRDKSPVKDISNPKSALTKKKKKSRKSRKSVTFCDDVALISTTEDRPPEPDYMQYVMRHLQHRKDRLHSLSSSSSSITSSSIDSDRLSLNKSDLSSSSISGSRSSSGGQGQGYDSDFEEEESEEEMEEEPTNPDQVQCSLCRRKWVDPPELYCKDCSVYMSQFQQGALIS